MKSFILFLALFQPITAAYPQQLSVKITSPISGSEIVGSLTVTGTSTGAASVDLTIDGGAFQTSSGVEQWRVVFEPGAIAVGTHSLIARATAASGAVALDTITVSVKNLAVGRQDIVYRSSVDGAPLGALLWTPPNLDLRGGPVPLLIHLHGGGGTGVTLLNHGNGAITRELDKRGWIGIGPDGREWGQHDQGCQWRTSAAYVDNPDPNVGPGEQDILDVITWAKANFPIDEDRIYLSGFSMGGRGTYIIGLKNPDVFAAIAPMAPATDMFEIFVRRPQTRACKEGMVGGQPGDSPFVDTMYKITSARFLIENAYNLPVFHGHGTDDPTAYNVPGSETYLHGFNLLTDTSWDGCHRNTGFCFGHTPTLSELHARHPEGYQWAYMFTPVRHTVDSLWVAGTPAGGDAEGVEDPQNPGNLIGMMEFFSRHTRERSPETVVFKTFTDTHRKAYWLEVDITTPWQNIPGAIRATRNSADNALQVELVRVDSVAFDLALAGLELSDAQPLTITMEVLNEPVFDPALDATGETLAPTVVLRGDFSEIESISTTVDGTALDTAKVELQQDAISLGPIDVSQKVTLVVQTGTATAVEDDGTAVPKEFSLQQNYPNPFNPSTTIRFSLPRKERVTLKVFDVLGREVATLFDEERPAGEHSVVFDAKSLTSGVYFYRIQTDNEVRSRKLLLLR